MKEISKLRIVGTVNQTSNWLDFCVVSVVMPGVRYSKEVVRADIHRLQILIKEAREQSYLIIPTEIQNIRHRYVSILEKWKVKKANVVVDEKSLDVLKKNNLTLEAGVKPIMWVQ